MRADSGFYNHSIVALCGKMKVRFSITVRQHQSLRQLIEAIPEENWTAIPYWMEGAADVAEAEYTPFRSEADAAPVRLIVRRVRPTPGSQLALFASYSYHAFITDREGDVLELEAARAPDQGPPRSHSSPNFFSNMVFCGKYSRLEKPVRMTVRRDNEGRPSLVCSRKRALRVAACDNQNVNLNQLHETTLDHLLGHVLTDDFLEEQVSLMAQKYRESVAQDTRKVATLKRRMTQNRSSSRNLTLTLEENGPNQDVSDRVNELREEYDKLDNQLNIQQESMKTRAAFVNTPEVIIANAMDKRTYLESKDPHTVKQLVKLFINEITIIDRVATIEYRIPLPDEHVNPIWSETVNITSEKCLLRGL